MSVPKFHTLKIKEVRRETPEAVSVSFEIPKNLEKDFIFLPGQYLTLRKDINGQEVRRSYSICVAPQNGELRVAIKEVEMGKFSGFANNELKAGDELDVMTPMGYFTPHAAEKKGKHYVAFVAGSGITPVMSIMQHVLETEPDSIFSLVYGNKSRGTIIFREAIEGLKNKYLSRLSLYHILSRESVDVPLFNGRITGEKVKALCQVLIPVSKIDEAFICGPEDMIVGVRQTLMDLGLPQKQIHAELFSSPDQPNVHKAEWEKEHASDPNIVSRVTIKLDGMSSELELAYKGDSILDAALKVGADLPYACKGGVCSTCRARLVSGEVDMEVNYALEPEEVAKGYILTCQSHPKTKTVVVDFDS